LPEDGNPFSDYFMEQAIDSVETNLCGNAESLLDNGVT
jgi:hypothetical protein